jgi:hypothetical protein
MKLNRFVGFNRKQFDLVTNYVRHLRKGKTRQGSARSIEKEDRISMGLNERDRSRKQQEEHKRWEYEVQLNTNLKKDERVAVCLRLFHLLSVRVVIFVKPSSKQKRNKRVHHFFLL